MRATEVLRLMRDVPGIAGSCLLAPDSAVLARDVPSDIDDDLLRSVGQRAEAALSAARQPLPGATGLALRFSELSVFCARAGSNLLLLLTSPEASTASVGAAMNATAVGLARVSTPEPDLTDIPVRAERPRRGDGIWG